MLIHIPTITCADDHTLSISRTIPSRALIHRGFLKRHAREKTPHEQAKQGSPSRQPLYMCASAHPVQRRAANTGPSSNAGLCRVHSKHDMTSGRRNDRESRHLLNASTSSAHASRGPASAPSPKRRHARPSNRTRLYPAVVDGLPAWARKAFLGSPIATISGRRPTRHSGATSPLTELRDRDNPSIDGLEEQARCQILHRLSSDSTYPPHLRRHHSTLSSAALYTVHHIPSDIVLVHTRVREDDKRTNEAGAYKIQQKPSLESHFYPPSLFPPPPDSAISAQEGTQAAL
ncbi:hypothetical protein R3P38DRAFT_3580703 [Favolaschia claudopus]|uniref:Uncharacterized protein n=1 Tax=Favolaschia claudopus TaxID=2862362 RepID=A0AAW0AKK2_9AGAR